MKKWIALLSALLMLVTMMPAVSAEDDKYNDSDIDWSEHTVHEYSNDCDRSCNVCGALRPVEELTHSYIAATCTAPATCTVCGATEGEALGHTYDDDTDPTCNVCGEEREIESPNAADYVYSVAGNVALITGYVGNGGAITVPNKLGGYPVVSIGEKVFRNNDSITSVVIPDGVLTIGEDAFYNCNNLMAVTLPEGLTTIVQYAFYSC